MTQTESGRDIPKAYNPKEVEEGVYESWVSGGYFTPKIDRSKKPFVVIMPPPNVTGALHVGHALTTALEDLMIRWHRMRGEPTLYLPGTDHAGIATQWVVERMLASEGITRHQLGREGFIERVWAWVDQYGDAILQQLKRLGASCDWTRRRFTLDGGPSSAVRTTFVNLYEKGLIYRGERITNWCPRCASALSDLEVEHQEESANLFYIRYLLEDGSGAVTVATTRPETLLGDTAVAAHPDDERYATLIGKNVVVPVLKRAIPIVADDTVDPAFGTGALKVTPGHDPADFEIGQRHSLRSINVMNLDGTMNESAGHYQGQARFECRKNIVDELDGDGLLEKVEPYHHSVGHCDRCDEIVEPIVSKQWYMKMGPLANPARDAVADGSIKIVPDHFAKVYFNWMDNIRDWCISRQLWWGHRIPVWYCADCDGHRISLTLSVERASGHQSGVQHPQTSSREFGTLADLLNEGKTLSEMDRRIVATEISIEATPIVSLDPPKTCLRCDGARLLRDPDVLDTWFSSGLWTHSTLGWPEQTEDLDYFYPTSVMETGYDILFLWVARMIMLGIENMGEIPFHTVYLHGLVLDPDGVRMSKTRGNVLDPLELIDMYGADAVRFALTTGNSPGNNMRLNEQRLEASRNFANKLWNAARFVISNLEGAAGLSGWPQQSNLTHRHDRWILSRFNRVAAQVERFMEEYQFGEAQRVVHDFLWNEYCDWYIEMAKIRLRSPDDGEVSPLPVLAYVLERTLRLLHPFLPFITEEIWRTLRDYLPEEPGGPDALIVAPYPISDPALMDDQAEAEVEAVIELVRAVRNLRAEFRIQASQSLEAIVDTSDIASVVESEAETIKVLARVKPLTLGSSGDAVASADRAMMVVTHGTITIPLHGLVDVEREEERLTGEVAELDAYRDRLSARLRDEQFLAKAPEEVVERERQRLEGVEERRSRIAEILTRLG